MNKAFRVACMLSRFSRVRLFATLWTIACQAPLSRGFSRQDYWSGLSCPSPGDLPDPGVEPSLLGPLHWQAGSLALQPPGKPQGLGGIWGYYIQSGATEGEMEGDLLKTSGPALLVGVL